MSIAQSLLAEFEHEVPVTRRFLERLPEDKLAWKPHEKSMTAGELALHIAQSPGQVARLASEDVVPMPNFGQRPQPRSVKEVLQAFDECVAEVRRVLPSMDDTRIQGMWRAQRDGVDAFAMPRVIFLRNIMLNHWYQHRGQFGVYLRLLNQNVPASYGPSADENPIPAAEPQPA